MTKQSDQDERIASIVGGDEAPFEDAVERFYRYMVKSLQLPCEVTGIEDFNWEEIYVFGGGDPAEYEELRKTQPSFKDTYELLEVFKDQDSEWMLFFDEDLATHVRRKTDGKKFHLGLCEIKAVDKKSKNYEILDDYSVWFVNCR